MWVVGVEPDGTPQRPSRKSSAVFAWAPARLNWPVKDSPSQAVESFRSSRRRCATSCSLSHMTPPGRARTRSISSGGANRTVLGVFGGVSGAALGWMGVKALKVLMPRSLNVWQAVELDWRVLAATACVSIAAGILFGLYPALIASRLEI